jgi:hypothetical protein
MAPTAPTSPLATPPSGSVPQSVVPIASAPAPTSPASPVAHPSPRWNSAIVPDFPKLFEDFKEKHFTLLWRGNRDDFGYWDFHRDRFGARVFHSRCDRHPNTLTVILDTNGNIFGAFTPVAWESPWLYSSIVKADPSLKSFIFTLKNPHNFPARRFALKAEMKDKAIWCNSDCGPHFCDLSVRHNCNTSTENWAGGFDNSYTNDTGLDENTFFTGSFHFQFKEIEVFEITK